MEETGNGVASSLRDAAPSQRSVACAADRVSDMSTSNGRNSDKKPIYWVTRDVIADCPCGVMISPEELVDAVEERRSGQVVNAETVYRAAYDVARFSSGVSFSEPTGLSRRPGSRVVSGSRLRTLKSEDEAARRAKKEQQAANGHSDAPTYLGTAPRSPEQVLERLVATAGTVTNGSRAARPAALRPADDDDLPLSEILSMQDGVIVQRLETRRIVVSVQLGRVTFSGAIAVREARVGMKDAHDHYPR